MVVLVTACGPSGGDDDSGDAGNGSPIVSLIVEPPDPVLVSVNGSTPAATFTARATYEDGTSALVSANWALSDIALGSLGADNGEFVSGGIKAGAATVSATVGTTTAETSLTVRVEDEIVGEGVPADVADRFTDPQPGAGSANVLYPLNGAMLPSSIKPVHIQWDVGNADDLYRVTITAGLATTTAYLLHSGAAFDFAWMVDPDSWRRIKNSRDATPITIVVDRYDSAASMAYASAAVGVNMVNANLDGAIYYWDLAQGKMLRITEEGREDFMPSPPASPDTGSRCIACHTVSRDGRYLAGELWGGNQPGAIFDLSADLSVDPAPTVVGPGNYTALFSTFSPDASQLLINYAKTMELRDAMTGALIPTTGLPTTGAAHPTWSPDGTLIAYIANSDGTWAVDFTVGDLAILPVNGTDFGPSQTLWSADGMANAWPSFSPDSQWIAFGRGTNSRARRDDIGAVYPGSLFLTSRSGGQPVALANANGGALDSYLPNFSPFNSGGYYWLAFYSTRDYGNAQVGTRGSARRQLWVTAVSNNPQPGVDPSNVGFWLPDQDVSSDNMSAYWAPRPPVD